MVWYLDGRDQHLTALSYYGVWLRDIVRNIFVNHSFSVPTFSFGLGFGGDIVTILHFYAIGDPFDLLSVFVPRSGTAVLYHFLIVLRLYLAGAAFSGMCFFFDKSRSRAGVLAGAMIYIFGGFAMFSASRHPFFINPMIFLPLIIIGVEKVRLRQSPVFLILGVFFAASSQFYFFYMTVIFVVLYTAMRIFFNRKEFDPKSGALFLLRLALCSALGVMMAAVIVLPVIIHLLNDPRMSSQGAVELFYPSVFYKKTPMYLLSLTDDNAQWFHLGFTGIILPALFALFSKRGERGMLKVGFVGLSVFALLPFFGHVFNGMSYPSNRWIWVFALLCAYIVADVFTDMLSFSTRKRLVCLGFIAAFGLLCLCFNREAVVWIQLFLAVTSVVLVGALGKYGNFKAAFMLCAVLAGIVSGNCYSFMSSGAKYLSKYYDRKNFSLDFSSNEATLTDREYDDDFGRYTNADIPALNASLLNGQSSTQAFFSLTNPNVFEFFTDLNINIPMGQLYYNIDDRTAANTLAGVNRYVSKFSLKSDKLKDPHKNRLPFGYSKTPDRWVFTKDGALKKYSSKTNKDDVFKTYTIYENENTLPFGFTYSSCITRDEFKKLSPIQRQEAMLQCAVLDEEQNNLTKGSPQFTSNEIPFKIKGENGAVVGKNKIVTTKNKATVVLSFTGEKNCETYFGVTGLGFKGTNPMRLYEDDREIDPKDKYDKKKFNALSKVKQEKILALSKNYKEPEDLFLRLKCGKNSPVTKKIRYLTPQSRYYEGVHDFLVNLNYSEKMRKEIVLTLPYRGVYTFDSIKVFCQPLDKYPAQVAALKEEALTDTDFHRLKDSAATNEITGKIKVSSDKLLLLSVPYSKGWTAYVDGKETPLLRANTMFSGVYLKKGSHDVRLVYRTPGLLIGFILSVIGVLLFAALIIVRKKRLKADLLFSKNKKDCSL